MKTSGFITYKRLLLSTKMYLWFLFLGVVGTIFLSGVDASFMGFIKPIIDLGFVKKDTHFVHFLPLIVIFIFVARGVANFMSNYYITRVSRSIVRDFRSNLFKKLQTLPASYFDTHSSGHVISTILYNVEQVAQASSNVLITILRETTLFLGLIVVMFVVVTNICVCVCLFFCFHSHFHFYPFVLIPCVLIPCVLIPFVLIPFVLIPCVLIFLFQ